MTDVTSELDAPPFTTYTYELLSKLSTHTCTHTINSSTRAWPAHPLACCVVKLLKAIQLIGRLSIGVYTVQRGRMARLKPSIRVKPKHGHEKYQLFSILIMYFSSATFYKSTLQHLPCPAASICYDETFKITSLMENIFTDLQWTF